MALQPGTRVGGYEVVGLIGSGAMGEVYRARDLTLHRDIALKVLPDFSLGSHPGDDRSARFQREAQLLAAMNHPHIAQIYGFESSAHGLAMELVDGPTLAERIAEGPIPLAEARRIALEIADALDAAHKRGVVHRDLKPANIKLTASGSVKVLDFGLAKLQDPGRGALMTDRQDSATMTGHLTEAGVILGTVAYMAPEQAAGRATDKRVDIWAFGLVVWEMLTGDRPFVRATPAETLAAVISSEPDFARVPPQARRLLRRCLDKDPKRRLRDIGEVVFLLDDAAVASVAPQARRAPWIIAAVAVMAAAILSAVVLTTRRSSPAPRPLMRFDLAAESSGSYDGLSAPAISPDGVRIIYPARGGTRPLQIREINQAKVVELAGTEGATQPFFSPDGQWIGFFADNKLKKVSVHGGTPVILSDASNGRGASWGDDGFIVAALLNTAALSRVPSGGGKPEPVTQLEDGELTHRWPQMLPGSAAMIFTGHTTSLNSYEDASIDAYVFASRTRKTVWRGGYFGRYLPTAGNRGHLLYVRGGQVFAVSFDPVRLEVDGAPVPVLDDAAADPGSGSGKFDASASGAFVYASGEVIRSWPISWLDSAGAAKPLIAKPGLYYSPRFSPDGRRLALAVDDGKGSDIFVYDWAADSMQRLTFTGATNTDPVWAPDGAHIVFKSRKGENWQIWWTRADGAVVPHLLADAFPSLGDLSANALSADGRRLIYVTRTRNDPSDIWILPIDPSDPDRPRAGAPEAWMRTPANETRPAFSPDGRWIAYQSNESGTTELFVRPSDTACGAGGRWQISTGGAGMSVWSRRTSQLFYTSGDSRLMVVDYSVAGRTFTPGKPRVWSPATLLNVGYSNMDLAPDSDRFAVFLRPELAAPRVTVLLNIFDELTRKTARRE